MKYLPILLILCACTPAIYETNTLLIDSLIVHDWCSEKHAVPVYEITIRASQGDILLITGEAEVTTELPYNICLCSSLYVNGKPITGVNGYNINRQRHHETVHKNGQFRVLRNGEYTVALMIYAASTDAKLGHAIKVEGYDPKNDTYYGKLSVVRIGGTI